MKHIYLNHVILNFLTLHYNIAKTLYTFRIKIAI